MLCHILGNVRLDPILILGGPVEEMRRIRAAHYVDRIDAAGLFLNDALIDAFGARALDANSDPGIFGFESARQSLRGVQLERRVERSLAFLPRCGDQRWRHFARRRPRGSERLGKNGRCTNSKAAFEYGASRDLRPVHAVPPVGCSPQLQVYTCHESLGSRAALQSPMTLLRKCGAEDGPCR